MHGAAWTWGGRALIALFLAAAGCAPETPHWVRPGVSAHQLEFDRNDCLARSQDYLPTGETKPNYPALEQCMARKGYSPQRSGSTGTSSPHQPPSR